MTYPGNASRSAATQMFRGGLTRIGMTAPSVCNTSARMQNSHKRRGVKDQVRCTHSILVRPEMQAFLWSRVAPEGARQASQSANAWGARLTCLVQPHMRQHFGPSERIIPCRWSACHTLWLWGKASARTVFLVLDTRPPGRHRPPQRLLGFPLLLER